MECSYIVGGKQNILTKCSGTPNYITTSVTQSTIHRRSLSACCVTLGNSISVLYS